MIAETGKMVQPYTPYTEYEMQWVGDFNPKMINMSRNIGDTFPSRKLNTYRYIFDRTVEFKRHPRILSIKLQVILCTKFYGYQQNRWIYYPIAHIEDNYIASVFMNKFIVSARKYRPQIFRRLSASRISPPH